MTCRQSVHCSSSMPRSCGLFVTRSCMHAGQLVTSRRPALAFCAQDIGARDPTAGEIESNFGDKVLGNYNTEHIIK